MRMGVLVVACAVGWSSLSAQQAPDLVLRSYYAALRERQWHIAAALLYPEVIAEARRMAVREALEPPRTTRGPTVERLMASDPEMPREVAEWQVSRFTRAPVERPGLNDYFARVQTLEELLALNLREAGARWLEAADPDYVMEQTFRQRCPDLPANAMIRARMTTGPVHEVIGAIASDSVAWAIIETTFPSAPAAIAHPSIVHMLLTPEGWRVVRNPSENRMMRPTIPSNVPCPDPGLIQPGTPGQRPPG